MRYCEGCGAEVPDSYSECQFCGAPVSQADVADEFINGFSSTSIEDESEEDVESR